ncbi:superinfection immunity protein [Acetobacteraceae bacterium ESL0709]|nr:superinfection immunity protein [Acetobacteraceae bacterium ESL0697]MDF7678761.1 superinfection immunity protein [Acetobacteraceae bacterium ESL0709]
MPEGYTQQDIFIVAIPTLIGLLAYFIPVIVVFARRVENKVGVILLNLFLGWTVIGWIIALVMAFSLQTEDQAVLKALHDQQE